MTRFALAMLAVLLTAAVVAPVLASPPDFSSPSSIQKFWRDHEGPGNGG